MFLFILVHVLIPDQKKPNLFWIKLHVLCKGKAYPTKLTHFNKNLSSNLEPCFIMLLSFDFMKLKIKKQQQKHCFFTFIQCSML